MKDLHIYQKKYNQYKALYLLNQQGGIIKYFLETISLLHPWKFKMEQNNYII